MAENAIDLYNAYLQNNKGEISVESVYYLKKAAQFSSITTKQKYILDLIEYYDRKKLLEKRDKHINKYGNNYG